MKKWISVLLLLLCIKGSLFADGEIEKLKKRIKMIEAQTIGWCSEEKTFQFLDLVLEVKPKLCVEIGVFGGASVVPVACGLRYLKEGLIIAIDPWDTSECLRHLDVFEDKEHIDWWSKLKMNDIYHGFVSHLIIYDLEDYCTIIRKTSQQAVNELEEDTVDILHVDGHRSEEMSMQDVKLYFPKVKSGGYIWMGDTLSFNKQSAIDYLMDRCDVVKVIDNGNCILFKKR